ncbi:MAG: hypothetical protein LBS74_10845 [Oscillospiraceae bacterium]|jgi:hypothetical protein|nr:hypothetical protein [Oscillospiraceae bacterium]
MFDKISNVDLYKIWAPDNAEWTAWAKPVLFASLSSSNSAALLPVSDAPVQLDLRTMIIVDLPEEQSVKEALAFAAKGYRPVPLYNGVRGEGRALVHVWKLTEALCSGANTLAKIKLPKDAPPVFMLDLNRMNGIKAKGAYDNRWCVFPQDMPSASYLKSKGISKIIVRTVQSVQTDLERILYDYQKNGIALYISRNNSLVPKELAVKKQSFAEEWAYRFKVTLGLKRNAAGGFGGRIPDPYESDSSGGGYYRFG